MSHFKKHNKKVASLRGRDWRKNLMLAKFKNKEITSLCEIRIEKGLSQCNMSKKLSIVTYRRIESGDRPAKKVYAVQIAKKLKVPLNKLFKKENNKYILV